GTPRAADDNGPPAVTGNAPVNVNTGVCVASDCSGSNASQQSGGGTSQTGGGGGGGGTQTADQSIGTGQVGSADVNPAAAVNAPINGNAPVCVASDCSGSNASQQAGGATASTGGGSGTGGGQSTDQSIGTAQVGEVNGSPAVTGNTPVNGNAPVCVASECSGSNASQQGGGGSSQTGGSGGGGTQTADQSIVTGQVGSADVNPAAAINAPINGNAPVCVASDCSGSNASQQAGGGTANTGGTGGTGGSQTADQSVITVQVGSVGGWPAATGNVPVNANTPVCVASDCSGS